MDTQGPRAALSVILEATKDGRLDEMCERFEVRLLSAFGSAARDSIGEPNDLDIGVSFRRDCTKRDPVGLWCALADLTAYEGIDVVMLDIDDPVLRAEALTGLPLYESASGEYAEAQIAALGEKRDTDYLRRRNLELMAK